MGEGRSTSKNFEDEFVTNECPYRALVAAVLERAYRDLGLNGYVEKHYRRKAISWFLDDNQYKTNYITYKQCIEVLELRAFQVKYLRNKVALAKRKDSEETARLRSYRQEEQEERENAGIRTCQLI